MARLIDRIPGRKRGQSADEAVRHVATEVTRLVRDELAPAAKRDARKARVEARKMARKARVEARKRAGEARTWINEHKSNGKAGKAKSTDNKGRKRFLLAAGSAAVATVLIIVRRRKNRAE